MLQKLVQSYKTCYDVCMDTKTLTDITVAQLGALTQIISQRIENLQIPAREGGAGDNSPTQVRELNSLIYINEALKEVITKITVGGTTPENLTPEEYSDFLTSQNMIDNITPDSLVAGTIITGDGELREVGNFDEAVAKVEQALLVDSDTEEEEVVDQNTITIVYHLDEDFRGAEDPELTVEQVHTILDSPISRSGLEKFGDLELLSIEEGESPAEKQAVFRIDKKGAISPSYLLSVVRYGGTIPFVGIGTVTASARVSLL